MSILSLFVALAAFLISLIGTRLLILAFRSRRLWLDIPNQRSNHSTPVPRGGGLAVVFALLIPMMIADINIAIVLATLLLVGVSMFDDLIGTPPYIRLLVQIIAVSIAVSTFPDIILTDSFLSPFLTTFLTPFLTPSLTPFLIKILIALCWIWFINLFNFMDGIDGISATEMVSIGCGISILLAIAGEFPSPLSHYAMIIAAAGLGFWWWNKQPAKIFLGDVGSIPIGFLTGYILLLAAYSGYAVSALIIAGYYLADSSVTIIRRIWRREKIWQAHSLHYYQQAARKGWSHNSITRIIAGVNVLLCYLATQAALNPKIEWLFSALALMLVFMVMGIFAHGNVKDDELKTSEKISLDTKTRQ